MNIKTSINFTGKLLAHVMGWFGEPGHTHRVHYTSNDSYVIERQLSCMQAVGIDGVIVTWQGATVNPYLHATAVEMCFQCHSRGMLFALLLDPWIVKGRKDQSVTPEQEIVNRLNDASTQQMLASSAYLPEKYILDFSTGADMAKVGASLPSLKFLSKHTGFSWPEITNTLSVLAKDNANPTMKIPGVCVGFNDGGFVKSDGTRDYAHSVWDVTLPTRVIDSEAGKTFYDQAALIPPGSPYAAIVTWNDHDEQTAIEQFASVASGIKIYG